MYPNLLQIMDSNVKALVFVSINLSAVALISLFIGLFIFELKYLFQKKSKKD